MRVAPVIAFLLLLPLSPGCNTPAKNQDPLQQTTPPGGQPSYVESAPQDSTRNPAKQPAPQHVKPGHPAPNFELPRLRFETDANGKTVAKISTEKIALTSFRGKKPVCLIFSSYTWPPFRAQARAVENLYVAYKEKIQFFLIYISEAHPEEKFEGKQAGQPKTLEGRVLLARKCTTRLKLSLPILMDTMDGIAEKAYKGKPDRICIVDIDGNVAYYSKRGPRGFKPKEAEQTIKKLLTNNGRIPPD